MVNVRQCLVGLVCFLRFAVPALCNTTFIPSLRSVISNPSSSSYTVMSDINANHQQMSANMSWSNIFLKATERSQTADEAAMSVYVLNSAFNWSHSVITERTRDQLIWSKIFHDLQIHSQLQNGPIHGLTFSFLTPQSYDSPRQSNEENKQEERVLIKKTTAGVVLDDVVAFFGPDMKTCFTEPKLAGAFDKLMIAASCSDRRSLTNFENFPTFIRLSPTELDFATAIFALANQFNWTTMAALVPADSLETTIDSVDYDSILDYLDNKNVSMQRYSYVTANSDQPNSTDNLAEVVLNSFLNTRIYLFFAKSRNSTLLLLNLLDRIGLLQTGEYIVLNSFDAIEMTKYGDVITSLMAAANNRTIALLNENQEFIHSNYCSSTQRNQRRQICAKSLTHSLQMAKSMIGIVRTPFVPSEKLTEIQNFFTHVAAASSKRRWSLILEKALETYLGLFKIRSSDVQIYDAVMLYANTITLLAAKNKSFISGSIVSESIRNKKYRSVAGWDFAIDSNGIVRGNISFLHAGNHPLLNNAAGLWPVATVWDDDNDDDTALELHVFNSSQTETNGFLDKMPSDEPRCGFTGSKCVFLKSETWKYIAIAGGLLALLVLVIIALAYRSWRNERILQSSFWKIELSELTIQRSVHNLKSVTSMRNLAGDNVSMMGSVYAMGVVDSKQPKPPRIVWNEGEQSSKLSDERDRKAVAVSIDKVEDFGVAVYKGNFVSLKRIFKPTVKLSRSVRKELKMVIDIKHKNLLNVIGIILESDFVFVVADYCSKGSLKDVLENDVIVLDDVFISSITFDVLKGLQFLHHTEFGCHGNLKSSNCLVDGRWVVKLSGFGLQEFRCGESKPNLDNEELCRSLLWKPPEMLRNPELPGSVAADVYAFGIILHEVFGRLGPFGGDIVDYCDAIDRLKFPARFDNEIFRPDTACIQKSAPEFVRSAMRLCWHEEPTKRLNLKEIASQLKPLTKGLKSNILDNMIAKMEKYTRNLEEIVAARTSQIHDEQAKSECLLQQMLPLSIIEQLKQGKQPEAESFDCVTIYFSDCVGFVDLVSQCSPIQIITFLNDLYSLFDEVLDLYDVYKVETISDSYVVVSGLPILNENRHAGQIAQMALRLLHDFREVFKVKHQGKASVQLRIGIHSGPCVAGVVGLRMPRYCLFGDTMNTASRMESNGEPLKIHCSLEFKTILDQLGGFEVTERGLVSLKGKGERLTYWLLKTNNV